MANRDTETLINNFVSNIVENTNGEITADVLRQQLIDIVQSRGLFEVYQSTKVYFQNEHISFKDSNVYKCVAETEAGQSPTTHPAKWSVIGSVSSIIAANVGYEYFDYTTVKEALDAHENLLSNIIPDAPDGLLGRSLTIDTYTALASGLGDVHECTDETQPEATIESVYDASSGDLSSEIDSVVEDTITLDENDNSGTTGSLTIVSESDPYEGALGQGIYSVLEAMIKSTSALSYALHTYRLIHSETGISNTLSFYVDDPESPTVTNVSLTLPTSASKYISGVPSLENGDEIEVDIDVTSAVNTHYNQTKVANVESEGTNSVDISPPTTPPNNGDTLNLNALLEISLDVFVENLEIICRGYNSKGVAGVDNSTSSNIYIDDVSDESNRLTSGSGQYPSTGYGTSYDSSQSLKTSYTNELQLKNGLYQSPSGDYSSNLPTNGESYDDGMGSDDRFCIPLSAFSVSNASGFTIEINDGENFTDVIEPDFILQVKLEGITGWLNANLAYSTGSPESDGDACLVYFDSSEYSKRITFGDTLRTGIVYVRLGLPSGDSKKFSGITISNII